MIGLIRADGEVRLAQGLQVLDLRDLVDPPGRPARRGQQGAHDPDPGPRRRARSRSHARRARAVAQLGRAPSDEEIASARSCRSRRCARSGRRHARSPRPTRRSAPTATRGLGDLFAAERPATEDEVDAPPRGRRAARRREAAREAARRDLAPLRTCRRRRPTRSSRSAAARHHRERVRQIEAAALRRLAEDESIADAV